MNGHQQLREHSKHHNDRENWKTEQTGWEWRGASEILNCQAFGQNYSMVEIEKQKIVKQKMILKHD